MSSISPCSEAPVLETTRDMAEVITLSDDDEVMSLAARQPMIPRTNSDANQSDSIQATAHIGAVVKLSLEDLQLPMKRLSGVVSRNQALLQNDGNGQVIRRSLQPIPIRRPVLEQVNIPRRTTPPVNHNLIPSTSTNQRTRRDRDREQNAPGGPGSVYKGHYMFEATEGYEPSRRSTRFNTKKIDGKFVCSYNPMKCYKLCTTTVEVINHAWAHVVHDPPPYINRAPRLATTANFDDLLMNAEGSQAILADNSRMILQKMQTCEYCNCVFDTVYKKQQHVVQCHLEQDSMETVCNICENDHQSSLGLTTHMQMHVAGDAPYNCRRCKYRTSVRSFFFQHFVEKHANEMLFCPICLYQEDLKPNTRRTKHIFVREFFDHMMKHVTNTQWRCRMCALSFNHMEELNEHRQNDHSLLNPLWQTNDRPTVHDPSAGKVSKRSKISILQKKFLNTLEGRRIADEVACKGNDERTGYDTTSTGNTLYECSCGNFKSYNGNRTASHFHRCRRVLKDIERERDSGRPERDPEEELKLFAVYPQMTITEEESREEFAAMKIEKDQYKVRTDEIEFVPIDDLLMLKMLATDKDRSNEIMEECYSKLKADDE